MGIILSIAGEKELKKSIADKEYKGVYLIYGEESYLKQHYVGLLRNKVVDKAFEDFNAHFFEGKSTSMNEIIRCAEILPMMSDRSCVIVRDYALDALSKEEMKTLEAYLSDVAQSSVLIFWMDAIEVNSKKSAKWNKIIKMISVAGMCVNLEKRDMRSLVKMVCDGGKKRNCEISADVGEYLVSQVGSDLRTLLNEVEKLSSFATGRKALKEDVDAVAVKSLEAKAFDLSKSIIRRDYEKAYLILNNLLALREEPVIILSAVSSSFVDMYRVKCAKIAGFQALDVGKHYNYRNMDFRLRNASRDCDALTVEQLRNSVRCLCEADMALKGSAPDKRLVLEETVVKLLLIARGDKV